MMGFGAIGPMPWLFGAIAMIIIWGGLWWGLSALVFHWPARDRSTPDRSHQHALRPVGPGWQIESFDRTDAGLERAPHADRDGRNPRIPTAINGERTPESDQQ